MSYDRRYQVPDADAGAEVDCPIGPFQAADPNRKPPKWPGLDHAEEILDAVVTWHLSHHAVL